MAKEIITTISCDICGAKDAESHSFIFDRRMDAAGSMEYMYYDIDLCSAHFAELARKHGDPTTYREREVGRSAAIAYGSRAKTWAQMQKSVWRKMTPDERDLALAVEAL